MAVTANLSELFPPLTVIYENTLYTRLSERVRLRVLLPKCGVTRLVSIAHCGSASAPVHSESCFTTSRGETLLLVDLLRPAVPQSILLVSVVSVRSDARAGRQILASRLVGTPSLPHAASVASDRAGVLLLA